jgi:hypothetical protein
VERRVTMAQGKIRYRLRVRVDTPARWIVCSPQYSYPRLAARAVAIRMAGGVAHIDLDDWYR